MGSLWDEQVMVLFLCEDELPGNNQVYCLELVS